MPLPGPLDNLVPIVSSASTTNAPFTSITALYDDAADSDSVAERLDLNAIIDLYDHATVEQLNRTFANIKDTSDLQSRTMDDSDKNIGLTADTKSALRFSTDFDTMDKDNYDI
jgi:hypothetical protein